jgi:hypothetical protein
MRRIDRTPSTLGFARVSRYVGACVVPIVVYGLWLIFLQEIGPVLLPGLVGFLILLMSATAGFALLKNELSDRRAVFVGLIYYPIMVAVLTYVGLVIGVRVYGEGP